MPAWPGAQGVVGQCHLVGAAESAVDIPDVDDAYCLIKFDTRGLAVSELTRKMSPKSERWQNLGEAVDDHIARWSLDTHHVTRFRALENKMNVEKHVAKSFGCSAHFGAYRDHGGVVDMLLCSRWREMERVDLCFEPV